MKNKLLLLSVTLLATCALSACQKANSKDSSVKKAAVSQKVDRSLYRNFYEIQSFLRKEGKKKVMFLHENQFQIFYNLIWNY